MATELEFTSAIQQLNEGTKKTTFAELIAKVWRGRIVEIYIGDTYEDIKLEDTTTKVPAVVIGKVVDAYAECIVLNCAYRDARTKTLKFGNIICLNERGIRTITEVDDNGILKDTFLNSLDGKLVKNAIQELKR